jgi:hypothetical protein
MRALGRGSSGVEIRWTGDASSRPRIDGRTLEWRPTSGWATKDTPVAPAGDWRKAQPLIAPPSASGSCMNRAAVKLRIGKQTLCKLSYSRSGDATF